jgi:predicted nuclease of restriction endonuclease-like RecB superfamily
MSQAIFQSYHPQVIIVDHFDLMINQIDIKTEKLFLDQTLPEETRNKLNDLREKQIKKIDEAKEMNLNHYMSEKGKQLNEEEAFREKWSHVIDDTSLEYEHKIDKLKEELILEDCVLLENSNEINGFDLWITSWFHNEKNLQFLK